MTCTLGNKTQVIEVSGIYVLIFDFFAIMQLCYMGCFDRGHVITYA